MKALLGLILLTAVAACSQSAPQNSSAADQAANAIDLSASAEPPFPAAANAANAADATANAAGEPVSAAPAPPSAPEHYSAHGQEPGWMLTIGGGKIDYEGNYGEKKISSARPEPRETAGGYRYEAGRLIVEIVHGRCNDAMSGQGFADRVEVRADGETYEGCGGERRPGWDM